MFFGTQSLERTSNSCLVSVEKRFLFTGGSPSRAGLGWSCCAECVGWGCFEEGSGWGLESSELDCEQSFELRERIGSIDSKKNFAPFLS